MTNYCTVLYCTDGNEFKRRNTADFSFEETNEAAREIVTEKNKIVNTDSSKQGNVEFVCDDCDAVYRSRRGLQQLTQAVHEGERVECKLCKYKGMNVTSVNIKLLGSLLSTHIKTIHEGVRYECNPCEYKANYESGLTRHIQSIHKGVRY